MEILSLFVANLRATFTIREVSLRLKKPYALIHRNISGLLAEGFIKKDRHRLLSLALENRRATLAYIEELRTLTIDARLAALLTPLVDAVADGVLLLYGSHARGDARRESDVDVLLIADDTAERERVSLRASRSRVHLVTVSRDEARAMLRRRDERNVVNETLDNHLVLANGQAYHGLVDDAG